MEGKEKADVLLFFVTIAIHPIEARSAAEHYDQHGAHQQPSDAAHRVCVLVQLREVWLDGVSAILLQHLALDV